MRRLAQRGGRTARPAIRRLSTRAHYLWRDEDSAGIELLSATLSLGFALTLLWHQSSGEGGFPLLWGAIAIMAGAMKVVGVFWEVGRLRMIGLVFGAGFWAAFAVIYGLSAPTPVWVVYTILVLAQIWALRRVVSP